MENKNKSNPSKDPGWRPQYNVTNDDLDYLNDYEDTNVKIVDMSHCCNQSDSSEFDNSTEVCFLGFMELKLGPFKVHNLKSNMKYDMNVLT